MSTSAEGAPEAGSAEPPRPAPPQYTPGDRVAPEDASLLWPEAHLLAEPPPDYRPLDMPAPWEPPPQATEPQQAVAPPQVARTPHPPSAPGPGPAAQPWPYAPYAPSASQPAAPDPVPPPASGPVPGYVISAPYEGAPARPERPAPSAPDRPTRPSTPRSFRDLRHGPLADRDFASMKEFAVAAVLEAGYAEADVARLFRFAPWQLRAWVDEARNASFGGGPA